VSSSRRAPQMYCYSKPLPAGVESELSCGKAWPAKVSGAMRLTDLVPILQMAIGPVILISGVGLLLLSMTNRLGRAIDRSRQLVETLRHADTAARVRISSQLTILSRRARLIRLAIIFATVSVLLAAILIIVLFIAALAQIEIAPLLILLFAGCMGSLIASLIVFILDINLSLAALRLEISGECDAEPHSHH
jgi:Protein of unknown function (DUF2721)